MDGTGCDQDCALVAERRRVLGATCPVTRVVSMGRRNTKVEPDSH
jgi:hypothetical protein